MSVILDLGIRWWLFDAFLASLLSLRMDIVLVHPQVVMGSPCPTHDSWKEALCFFGSKREPRENTV